MEEFQRIIKNWKNNNLYLPLWPPFNTPPTVANNCQKAQLRQDIPTKAKHTSSISRCGATLAYHAVFLVPTVKYLLPQCCFLPRNFLTHRKAKLLEILSPNAAITGSPHVLFSTLPPPLPAAALSAGTPFKEKAKSSNLWNTSAPVLIYLLGCFALTCHGVNSSLTIIICRSLCRTTLIYCLCSTDEVSKTSFYNNIFCPRQGHFLHE